MDTLLLTESDEQVVIGSISKPYNLCIINVFDCCPFRSHLHIYTFLEISSAGIYGLCMNSMVHYIRNYNLYNQFTSSNVLT